MSNKLLIKTLPIVASALGKKYGVKVSVRADMTTAATDGKNIYLPVLPDTDEALRLARGYIDHESAHIRYTDFSVAMGKGLKKSIINVLEDIRIEQNMSRELPGCKINLLGLEEAFVEGGVYEAVTDQSHPAEILIARIHHCLRVSVLNNLCTTELADNAYQVFAKAFPDEAVKKIDQILSEADSLRDTHHVDEMANKILEVIQEDQDEQENQDSEQESEGEQGDSDESSSEDQSNDSDSSGDGQSGQGDSSDDSDSSSEKGNDEGSDESDGSSNSGGSNSEEDDSSEGDQKSSQGGEGDSSDSKSESQKGGDGSENGDGTDESTQSESGNQGEQSEGSDDGSGKGRDEKSSPANDANKKANLETLKSTADEEIVKDTDMGDLLKGMISDLAFEASCGGGSSSSSGTFPQEQPKLTGYNIDPFETARETNALRTKFNGLLQASKLKRSPPRRVGSRVDSRSLHKLRTMDSRVFRGRESKSSVNTGVVVLIDQSGSMRFSMEDATKTAMAVSLALDAIPGVKLAIAGFNSVPEGSTGRYVPAVTPMKGFNQRTDKKGFVPAAGGGTPIAEGLWWSAAELMSQNTIERRLVICVTDGRPDDHFRTKSVVDKLHKANIETYAIGLGVDVSRELFPVNCTINQVSELPAQVFSMLESALIV